MYIIPPLQNDELFESWLLKICLYNDSKLPYGENGRDLKISDITLLNSREIFKICQVLRNYIDCDFMSIIDNHTLLPYINPFTDSKKIFWKKIKMNYFEYLDNAKTYHADYFNIRNYKVCTHCINEEVKNFGEAYIHRIHQVPLNFFCQKHNSKLKVLSKSNSYEDINLYDNLPELEELSDKYLEDLRILSNEIHYVTNGALRSFTIDYIKMIIWIRMDEKGYINNMLIKDEFYHDFYEYYGHDFLLYVKSLLENVNEDLYDFKKLHLVPGATKYSPTQVILIVRMLFESGLREFVAFSRRTLTYQKLHKLISLLKEEVNINLYMNPGTFSISRNLYEYLLESNGRL